MLRKTSTLAALVCALSLTGATVGAAFAGEVTGNEKPTGARENANSICAYSGQNDDPNAPPDGPNGPGGRTQSYGQDVKLGLANPHAFNPGDPDACRGGSNFRRNK